MKQLKKYISNFLYHLRNNNYSPNSIDGYAVTLKFYCRFLEILLIKPDQYFTLETAVRFKLYLYEYYTAKGSKLRDSTIQGYYDKVQSFHHYLLKESYILVDPYKLIEPVKIKKHLLKKSIPVEDIKKILAHPHRERGAIRLQPPGYKEYRRYLRYLRECTITYEVKINGVLEKINLPRNIIPHRQQVSYVTWQNPLSHWEIEGCSYDNLYWRTG